MFKLDPQVNDAGTSLVAEIDVAPAFLVDQFGVPINGDGYRCTGRYKFVDSVGNVFTVYEYQSTAAYLDDEEDALPPDEFWMSTAEEEFSVGGFGIYGDQSAHTFLDWLNSEYRRWQSSHDHTSAM